MFFIFIFSYINSSLCSLYINTWSLPDSERLELWVLVRYHRSLNRGHTGTSDLTKYVLCFLSTSECHISLPSPLGPGLSRGDFPRISLMGFTKDPVDVTSWILILLRRPVPFIFLSVWYNFGP